MTVEGTLEGLSNYSFQMHDKGMGQLVLLFAKWYLQIETGVGTSFVITYT